MKIILEGTEAELRSALHSFGIPSEVAFDDGKQFLCSDIVSRENRRRKSEDTLTSSEIDVGFRYNSDNNRIKAIAKEQADRRRQVRQQLNPLLEQAIPEAVANYFKGNKLSVSFEKR